jgi:hypothetical protein
MGSMLIKNKELNNMEINKERRIEILNNTIEKYKNLLAKYGNVSTWKNYVKKAEVELNQLKESA